MLRPKEVERLKALRQKGYGSRAIAKDLNISPTTAFSYIKKLEEKGELDEPKPQTPRYDFTAIAHEIRDENAIHRQIYGYDKYPTQHGRIRVKPDFEEFWNNERFYRQYTYGPFRNQLWIWNFQKSQFDRLR